MIHADAGWPQARDEREPMCGRTGEASSALTLLPARGARSRGEEEEREGVDGDGHVWDSAFRTARSELLVPPCLRVPKTRTGRWWPGCAAGR